MAAQRPHHNTRLVRTGSGFVWAWLWLIAQVVADESASLAQAPRGFSCQEYVDESGFCTRYILFRPYRDSPEGKYPLILFLNGYGENGSDGVSQLSNNLGHAVWDARYRFPFLLVAPQMSADSSWLRADSAVASATIPIIDQACEQLGADASRVYVTGPSSGGAGTVALAERFSERFAAAVPVATGYSKPLSGMPVWTFLNGRDRKELVEGAEKGFLARIQQGEDQMTTLYAWHGHNAWTNAYQDPAMYHWLLRHRLPRSPDGPRYQPTPWPPDDLQKDHNWAARLPVFGDELHFQYWSPDKKPCQVQLWHWSADDVEPVWEPVASLHLCWPEDGSCCLEFDPRFDLPLDSRFVYADPLAERSLASNRWNNISVIRSVTSIEVRVNGWTLLQCSLPAERKDDSGDLGSIAGSTAAWTPSGALGWSIGLRRDGSDPSERIRAVRVGPRACESSIASEQCRQSWRDLQSSHETDFQTSDWLTGNFRETDQQLTVSELLSAWQEWERQWPSADIRWRRSELDLPVQWFYGNVRARQWWAEPQRVIVNGNKFQWHSKRPFQETPLEGWRVASSVVRYLPERLADPFIHQLYSRFAVEPNDLVPQSFLRQFDGRQLLDWWQPLQSSSERAEVPSRARVHLLPETATAESLLLQLEQHPNDRCSSLELSACLLALRPLGCPLHPLDTETLTILPGTVVVDGIECLRVTDTSGFGREAERVGGSSKLIRRRLWMVSGDYPHHVQRYCAESGSRGVQIDIRWTGEGSNRQPTGWRYQLFHTDDSPSSYFGSVQVDQWRQSKQPWQAAVRLDQLPVGTWVLDAESDSQYLTEAGGERREIAPDEIVWLPTYAELRRAGKSHVSWQLYRQILPLQAREYWQWLLGGVIGFSLFLAVVIRLRQHRGGKGSGF
jgi:poly(3-hydroxybutyrate) depolymerase